MWQNIFNNSLNFENNNLIKEVSNDIDMDDIQTLGLSARTYNALRRSGIMKISLLKTLSTNDILGIRSMGIRGLEEIMEALALRFSGEEAINIRLTEEAEISLKIQEIFTPVKELCHVFDQYHLLEEIGLPESIQNNLNMVYKKKAITLEDLNQILYLDQQNYINQDLLKEYDYTWLKQTLSWLQSTLDLKNIDDEINTIFGDLENREQYIFVHRYVKNLTLETLGKEFGITRERVRQIEKKARNKLAYHYQRSSMFYTKAALVILRQMGDDANMDKWKQKLKNMGFLKDESKLDLFCAIYRAIGTTEYGITEDLLITLVKGASPRLNSLRKPVLAIARKFNRNSGAVRAAALLSIYESLTEMDIAKILTSDDFIEVYPGWWTRRIGEYVPDRVAEKVLINCGPVSPNVMRHALRRHLRRLGFPAPPSEVLGKSLEIGDKFTLNDGLLHLNNKFPIAPTLTSVESVFVQMVSKEGPVISFESIHSKIMAEGLSGASVTHLLSFSPIVQKISLGLYTLLGTKYDTDDVERARLKLTKVSANSILKPRSDGVIEYETNVGNWMIYGGIISIGRALKLKGTWKLVVDDIPSGNLIVSGNFIRGLLPAIAVLNLRAGDRIRMEFNTWIRKVTIIKVVNYANAPSYKRKWV